MLSLDDILKRNARWAQGQTENNPEFFNRLAEEHTPEILWIGCSDGRVPPDILVPAPPGTFFVHRNIGNVFAVGDLNWLAVLQYAVEELRVKRVIVCGHHRCGGIRAALNRHGTKPVDLWTDHIRQLARLHKDILSELPSQEDRHSRMTELNVESQVRNICRTAIVQEAWLARQNLAIVGLVYDVGDGLLEPITPELTSTACWAEWDTDSGDQASIPAP